MSSSRHSSRAHSTSSTGESYAWQSKLKGSSSLSKHLASTYLYGKTISNRALILYANATKLQTHAANTRSPRPHSKSSQTEEVSRNPTDQTFPAPSSGVAPDIEARRRQTDKPAAARPHKSARGCRRETRILDAVDRKEDQHANSR
jgi:hypothetical protein